MMPVIPARELLAPLPSDPIIRKEKAARIFHEGGFFFDPCPALETWAEPSGS